MKAQIWINEYENLMKDNNRLYALDRLLEAVKQYPDLYRASVKWNVTDKVSELYQKILDELNTKFGLTQEQAQEIASIINDVEYTKKLREIINDSNSATTKTASDTVSSDEPKETEKDMATDLNPDEGLTEGDKTPAENEAMEALEEWIPAVIDEDDEKLLPQDAQNE